MAKSNPDNGKETWMAPMDRPWPWRMIVRGGFQDSWSMASQAEKNDVFAAWLAVQQEWASVGCRLITTLDDELNMVGQPRGRLWNFYTLWEIPDPGIVYDLLNLFRTEEEGAIRLDRYFSIETVVGKPVLSLERALGVAEPSVVR
jgi:hypothetical protein